MDRLAKNAVVVVCKTCKQPLKPKHLTGNHWFTECCDNMNYFEQIVRFLNK